VGATDGLRIELAVGSRSSKGQGVTYLGKGGADVNDTDLGTPLELVAKGHRVGHDKGGEDTGVEVLNRVSGQDSVGDQGEDGLGAVLLEDSSRLAESS